jgi:hypothetical protein
MGLTPLPSIFDGEGGKNVGTVLVSATQINPSQAQTDSDNMAKLHLCVQLAMSFGPKWCSMSGT